MRVPSAIEGQLGGSNIFDTIFLAVILAIFILGIYRALASRNE